MASAVTNRSNDLPVARAVTCYLTMNLNLIRKNWNRNSNWNQINELKKWSKQEFKDFYKLIKYLCLLTKQITVHQ